MPISEICETDFENFVANIAISFIFGNKEFTAGAIQIPWFWQNFQFPCVFPDGEFCWVIFPVFPPQWGTGHVETPLVIYLRVKCTGTRGRPRQHLPIYGLCGSRNFRQCTHRVVVFTANSDWQCWSLYSIELYGRKTVFSLSFF